MEKQKVPEQLGPIQTAEFYAGSVDYVVTGNHSGEYNRLMIVPGFTEGFVAMGDFAKTLCDDDMREVILLDQPRAKSKIANRLKGKSEDSRPSLDVQAEAVLAVIEQNDWQYEPMDFVTHSMGALVLVRAAEIAKTERWEWKSFDSEAGSRSVFIAPAGTVEDENIRKIAPRYLKLLSQIGSVDKKLDKTIANNGVKEFLDKPIQHTREALGPVIRGRVTYNELGRLGLKPSILAYPEDPMYPHEIIGPALAKDGHYTSGHSMPVDARLLQRPDGWKLFQEIHPKLGEKALQKAWNKAWLMHYQKAGHNDLLYNTRRTANAVRQILDRELGWVDEYGETHLLDLDQHSRAHVS